MFVALCAPRGSRRTLSVLLIFTLLLSMTGVGEAAAASPVDSDPLDAQTSSMRLSTAPLALDEMGRFAADLDPFVLVGFSWLGRAQVVQVTTSFEGTTAPTHLLGIDHHDADDGSGERHFTRPLWVGAADRLEISIVGDARNVRAHVVVTDEQRSDDLLGPASTTTPDDGRPEILSRTQWGPRATEDRHDAATSGEFVVVHHTGMAEHNEPYTAADVPALLRAVQTFHIDGRGWNDIGYNFLIDRFGRIWEGRGRGSTAIIGAHAAYVNTASVGVSYLGEFDNAAPTQEAISSGAELISWLWFIHGIDPDEPLDYQNRKSTAPKQSLPRLVGHRDVGATSCPGHDLYELLPALETSARSLLTNRHGERLVAPTTVAAAGGDVEHAGDFDGDGRTDLLLARGGGWRIWFGNGSSVIDRSLPGPSGAEPLAGDFDGDGYDDVLWWDRGGAQQTWFGRPDKWFDTGATELKTPVDDEDEDEDAEPIPRPFADVRSESAGRQPVSGDFDGDGDTDILWHDARYLNHLRWHGRTARHFESEPNLLIGAEEFVVGDLDGDTIEDIIWLDPETGARPHYGSHRDHFVPGPVLAPGQPGTAWTADIDGREGVELVWAASSSSARSTGASAQRVPRSVGVPIGQLGPWASGDLDGDARPDHLVVTAAQATVDFGDSQATLRRSRPEGEPVIGDFDGDGLDDVLWVSSTASRHELWISS